MFFSLHPVLGVLLFCMDCLGILFSPSKGLFTYSPILLFAFVGIFYVWKNGCIPLLKYLDLDQF